MRTAPVLSVDALDDPQNFATASVERDLVKSGLTVLPARFDLAIGELGALGVLGQTKTWLG